LEKHKGELTLKKVLIFGGIIVVIFVAIAFLTKMANPDYYKNAITPEQLEEDLASGESQTVYFYSPTCSHCQAASPIVFPMAEELGFELKPYNVDEHPSTQYKITSTPTIIHFEDGKEVSRIEGNVGEEKFKEFFETNVVDD
jgi:thioredoxin 1